MSEDQDNSSLPARVATAVQGKVFVELQEEISVLKKRVKEARQIRITGSGRQPAVYAQATFENGQVEEGTNRWIVPFQQQQNYQPCCLRDLLNFKIQLGAVGIHAGPCSPWDFAFQDADEEIFLGGMANIFMEFPHASSLLLQVEVGPFPNQADLFKILDEGPLSENSLTVDLLALGNTDHVNVYIRHISFDVADVQSLMEGRESVNEIRSLRKSLQADLAPFVLAYQENELISDLLHEVRLHRAYLIRLMTLTVTGNSGSPVYAEGQLETAFDVNYHWEVNFAQGRPTSQRDSFSLCRLVDFPSVKLFFNGFCFESVANPLSGWVTRTRTFQNNSGLFQILFGAPIHIVLSLWLSPFRDEYEYVHVRDYMDRNNGIGDNGSTPAQQLVAMGRETMIVRFGKIEIASDSFNKALILG